MLLHRLERDLPTLHRVALLALCAELPAVNVGVAICAFGADVGKDQARMTQATLHGFVHAAQRIARLVMVEFRQIADGLPAGEGVAVFARLVQCSVRAARGAALRGLLGSALIRLRRDSQGCADEQRPSELFPCGQPEHGPHPRAGVKNNEQFQTQKCGGRSHDFQNFVTYAN